MAIFCSRCGKPLANGETCSCSNQAPSFDLYSAKGYMESMKNRMGIGDPELNKGDAFEKGKQIIPDCVTANEGEIPVKQYEVATLRNRIFGIPYTKAVGRMQVTNKRVIFRAPGRCISGRTTLQHEFAIDELAGVEARREYMFNFWDLIFGLIVASFGGRVISSLITLICSSAISDGKTAGVIILTLLLGVAGCVPFFMLKKKWLLKLLCLGGSFVPMITFGSMVSRFNSGASEFFGGFLTVLGFFSLILTLFALFIHTIKPNLVLLIKTKSASDAAAAIDIKRKKVALFGNKDEDHTGYTEVIPAKDAERCIREINAIISDIQKLGDFGVEKWKK